MALPSKNSSQCKSCFKRTTLLVIFTSLFTLFLHALIVNFAPVSVTNIFLNPPAVVKGLNYEQDKMAQKEAAQSTETFKAVLAKNRERIFDKNAPFIGAKNAQVEIVVFADYRCVYCKALAGFEESILSDSKYKNKVKFIHKNYPILSPASGVSAVVAIEVFAKNPEKFAEINNALYEFKGNTKEEFETFLKAKKVKAINFENPAAAKQVSENLSLGNEIGVRGTPAIIIGEEIIGGLIPESDLRAKIDALL